MGYPTIEQVQKVVQKAGFHNSTWDWSDAWWIWCYSKESVPNKPWIPMFEAKFSKVTMRLETHQVTAEELAARRSH